MRSATLDQCGVARAITTDAVALKAPQEISGRAAQLLARQWQLSDTEVASLRTSMDCSHFPCLTANGRIKLTLSFIDDETQRKVSASAQEHLSPWL